MRSYEASSRIASPPDVVWPVLVHAADWPSWDSGVASVEGQIVLGEKLTIRAEVAKGRAFPVTVTDVRPGERVQFTGGMPLGLFRGVRTYTLSGTADGGTDFRMREEYTGPLVPLIWPSMPDLQPSFDRFATGLKERVETGG